MGYDPNIPLSLEEHSPTPIVACQPPLTSITRVDVSLTVSASDSLPNKSAINSVPERRYPLVNILLIDITNSLFVIYTHSFFWCVEGM